MIIKQKSQGHYLMIMSLWFLEMFYSTANGVNN